MLGERADLGLRFDVDSAALTVSSGPAIAALVAAHADWRLTIEGHTDATASAAHNQTLSEQRAAAVKAKLVGEGIAADRLTSAGFGATRPVADNATAAGRSQNRRVEVALR